MMNSSMEKFDEYDKLLVLNFVDCHKIIVADRIKILKEVELHSHQAQSSSKSEHQKIKTRDQKTFHS